MSDFDSDRKFSSLTEGDLVDKIEAKQAAPEEIEELTRRLGRIGLMWTWAVETTGDHLEPRDVVAIHSASYDEAGDGA